MILFNFFRRHALHFKIGATFFIAGLFVDIVIFGSEISVKLVGKNLVSAFLFGLLFPLIVKRFPAKKTE